MKMRFTYIIWIIFGIIITGTISSSCNKDTSNPDGAKPVVESYLQPGQPASVKLSRQLPVNEDDSTNNYAITNAIVKISYSGRDYELQHTTDGVYVNTQMPIVENGTYTLNISYNQLSVTASTTIPSKPKNVQESTTQLKPVFSSTPVEMMNVTWDNPNNDYYFILVKALDLSAPLNFNTFGASSIFDAVVDQGHQRTLYNQSFRYYGRHCILVYHVQSDYVSFYTSSGTSSLNATSIATSITNGYGIFTGINAADSLFVTVN